MEDILAHLCETNGVTGSLLVGKDGIVIASHLNSNDDPDLLGALVADLFGGVGNSLERHTNSNIELVSVEREDGKLLLKHIEDANALLAVLAGPKINMGLVRLEMKEASQQFKDMLM